MGFEGKQDFAKYSSLRVLGEVDNTSLSWGPSQKAVPVSICEGPCGG
jgi:hypothetical protein